MLLFGSLARTPLGELCDTAGSMRPLANLRQITDSYVLEAEKILTPYEFGVYDLLVLPPSFPYGGMVRLPFSASVA